MSLCSVWSSGSVYIFASYEKKNVLKECRDFGTQKDSSRYTVQFFLLFI